MFSYAGNAQIYHCPADHHQGSYNLSFADGHVQSVKLLEPEERRPWGNAPGEVGFLQRAIPEEREKIAANFLGLQAGQSRKLDCPYSRPYFRFQ